MNWRSVAFDWNRARAFLVTVEEGSFSAAARALGSSQPTVGRQVAALEQELGVALFERVGTRQELTATGLELLEPMRAMAEAAMKVSLTATGQASSVEGTVSITASEAVAAFLLPPILAGLRADHPGIEVELVATNESRDLHRREADIALRNFRSQQPDLIARKLRDADAGLYATPAFLDRIGGVHTDADLSRAELFAFDRSELMIQGFRARGLAVERSQFPIATGNHLVQWELCKQGVGICVMMCEVGDEEPRVQRILPDFAISLPLWLVCHRELRTSRRIRLVFDRLADELAQPRGGPTPD